MVHIPGAALIMITVQNTDSVFRVQYTLCSYDQDSVHVSSVYNAEHTIRGLHALICHLNANTSLLLFSVLDIRYDSDYLWYGHLHKNWKCASTPALHDAHCHENKQTSHQHDTIHCEYSCVVPT